MAELKLPKEMIEEAVDNVLNHVQSETGMAVAECYEKQIPKKPVCIEDKMWCCPACYNNLLFKWKKYPTELNHRSNGFNYCMACGQKLDWSEEDG